MIVIIVIEMNKVMVDLIGTTGAGKTTIAERLKSGQFNAKPPMTTGPNIVTVNHANNLITIRDHPGNERFQFMVSELINKQASIVCVVVDPNTKNSLKEAEENITQIIESRKAKFKEFEKQKQEISNSLPGLEQKLNEFKEKHKDLISQFDKFKEENKPKNKDEFVSTSEFFEKFKNIKESELGSEKLNLIEEAIKLEKQVKNAQSNLAKLDLKIRAGVPIPKMFLFCNKEDTFEELGEEKLNPFFENLEKIKNKFNIELISGSAKTGNGLNAILDKIVNLNSSV